MDFRDFVPNVCFEQIPIKNLVSNQDYQRSLSPAHVAKAAAEFDIYQINPVKVSRRGGVNYVFNGQHTIEIVAAVSGSRDTPVWCMIYDDLSYEHEADIFANQMRFVKKLQPFEIFNANIEAENHTQMMVHSLLRILSQQIHSRQQDEQRNLQRRPALSASGPEAGLGQGVLQVLANFLTTVPADVTILSVRMDRRPHQLFD